MPQREFANQKALVAYAEQNDLAYEYEYTPAFAKRQRLLSPEQYDIVEVRTSRGVTRVMLFSKAIIQAEWEANAPLRESMAIKRERLRARSGRSGRPISVQRETSYMRAMLAIKYSLLDAALTCVSPAALLDQGHAGQEMRRPDELLLRVHRVGSRGNAQRTLHPPGQVQRRIRNRVPRGRPGSHAHSV